MFIVQEWTGFGWLDCSGALSEERAQALLTWFRANLTEKEFRSVSEQTARAENVNHIEDMDDNAYDEYCARNGCGAI